MRRCHTLIQVLIGLWLVLTLAHCDLFEAKISRPESSGKTYKEAKGEDLLIKKIEPLLVMFKGTRRQNRLPHPNTPDQRYEKEGWYINKISTKKSSIGYIIYTQNLIPSISFLVEETSPETPSKESKLTGKILILFGTFENNRYSGNVLGEYIDRAGQIILNHPIGWDNEKDAIERGSFERAYGYKLNPQCSQKGLWAS